MIPGACDMNIRSSKQFTSVSNQGGTIQCSQQSILSAMERFVKSINNMDSTVLVPCRLRDMNIIGANSNNDTRNNNNNNNLIINNLNLNLKQQKRVPPTMTNTELYNFYLMLNDVKKELLWGTSSCSMMAATSHDYVFSSNNHNLNINISSSSSNTSSISNGSTMSTINQSTTTNDNNNNNKRTTTSMITNLTSNHHQRITCRQISKHSSQSSDESLGSIGSSISSNASDTESDADSMITDRDSIEDQSSHLFVAFRHHLQGLNSILNQLADSADYLSLRYQEEIEDI